MEATGTALVTGASRGIGRAVALELARLGFDVVAGMRRPDEGALLAHELSDARGSFRPSLLDVTDPDTICVPEGLRVLVNNAAIEGAYLPVEHAPIEDWRTVFDTNVFGVLDVTRRAIPVLRRSGGGVICNITSSSILVPVPFYSVYRASKAAISSMGETLSVELAPFGIRVVEVLPGPIATDMLVSSDRLPEAAGYEGYEDASEEMLAARRSVNTMITAPEDAASAIVATLLDGGRGLRHACDPLGQGLLDAWHSNPSRFLL